jgi:hypothetical protein
MRSSVKTSPLSRKAWSSLRAFQGFFEGPGHARNTGQLLRRGCQLFRGAVDVLVQRLARIDLVLDAVEARHHHGREAQVAVAGGSGVRYSTRFDLGLEVVGIRRAAERLRLE